MPIFVPGQRWISLSEPELGLGTILSVEPGRVSAGFSASGESRTYAADNAPLKRVIFREGDKICTRGGKKVAVTKVLEKNGLITYVFAGGELTEDQLNDALNLQGPESRLFAGLFDEAAAFELRRRTLELQHRARKSPVRGFVGGRIDLIPHQLYIAHEVAARQAPRVMLSDEVGLGKTIEACLILHRLLLSGRANRILVLVPESLVHQWFVEMLRRFNVWLNIYDEARCIAIEAGEPGTNPFLDDQLVLTNIEFLAGSPTRAAQAHAASWDMLVVDEAHHLQWSEQAPSREYQLVEGLSRNSEGLLLLTATPEQLGAESHFARLRLLDPDRYRDFASFQAEAKDYKPAAQVAEKLLTRQKLTGKDITVLRRLLRHQPELEERLEEFGRGDAQAAAALLDELLDLHGPGRVLFRNTRAAMTGFPKRFARLAELHPQKNAADWIDRVSTEFAVDAGDTKLEASFDLKDDPRILWLVKLLAKLEPQKVLLICRSIEKAEAIDEALRRHVTINTGIFHEGLTLVQRDRNAAWFAELDGARLLICSEIGSEGRNFQFAHHLVLFDLPLNPELLEQRIGRLDRIGQSEDIEIHVPFLTRSPQQVLAAWYHEGLKAFETNLEGATQLLDEFGGPVHDLALEYHALHKAEAEEKLAELLKNTARRREELRHLLEQGRDRLLEMNSFRPAISQRLIEQIQQIDQQTELDEYMLDVFERFGVHVEELAPRTWQLNPQGVTTDAFPAIPAEGMIATCDRARARAREDVGFLTWDHPMVAGVIDLVMSSEAGTASFATLPTNSERTLLLEMLFVLETLAAPKLHVDRFLPATPVCLVVNHKLEEVSLLPDVESKLRKGSANKLIDNAEIAKRTLPGMLQHGVALAEARAAALRQTALAEMNQMLGHEVARLKMLAKINSHVRPQEIQLAERQQQQLAGAITESRLRLDSLRLIWKGPQL